jgi:hypothetical protein
MHYALNNQFPIETAGQFDIALNYFDRYLGRFEPSDRVKVASSLEKRASDLKISVDKSWITNYSRATKSDAQYSPDFDMSIDARKHFCKSAGVKVKIGNCEEILDKLSSKKSELPPLAMVGALDAFDKEACLTDYYDRAIADPFMTVYGSNTNSEFDCVKLAEGVTDYMMKRSVCDKGTMEKVASALSKSYADEYSKDPLGTFEKSSPATKQLLAETIRK